MAKQWSNEELLILKEYYPTENRDKAYELIPNRSKESIRRKASSMNLSSDRINYVKREFNRDYFKVIDNANKAYWLGFIYADGYIEVNNLLGFRLKDNDVNHLNKFAKEINFNGEAKIEEYKYKESSYKVSRLTICGRDFVQSLKDLGLTVNKTLTIEFPHIREDLISHFVRGYFDGDGCIGIYKDRGYNKVLFSVVSGSESFVQSIKSYLEKFGNDKLAIRKTGNAYELRCQSLEKIKSTLDVIYKESNTENRLDRKYEIYLKFKETFSK